jgi:hypothetical protein
MVAHFWRSAKVTLMSAQFFSLKAEMLWQTVPPQTREAILREVWCGQCRTGVSIINYVGKEVGGDVILEGQCGVCGGRVARHVETSEAKAPPN